jgi:Tol biopolymer transport system component
MRLSTVDKSYIVRADGTDQRSVAFVVPPHGQLSPDGTRRLAVDLENGRWVATVSDPDGKNAKRLTESTSSRQCASWSPDGKRIAYASDRSGKFQIYTIDPDGTNEQQITQEPIGAWQCQYGPGGQLAFLSWTGPLGKLRPSDLVVADNQGSRKIAENTWIGEFNWSPDGKTIAYSKYGSLVFYDLESGQARDVVFKDIDARLSSHAAFNMNWRPDSRALTCSITFLGGRMVGTQIFGDEEIFVIPRNGQPIWFTPTEKIDRVEWVKSN